MSTIHKKNCLHHLELSGEGEIGFANRGWKIFLYLLNGNLINFTYFLDHGSTFFEKNDFAALISITVELLQRASFTKNPYTVLAK